MVFDLLLIGIVIAIEPIPLTAIILVLSTDRGVRNGLGFVFGWMASIIAVVGVTLLLTGGAPPKPATAPSTAILIARIVVGLGLIALGLRQRARQGRPRKPPKWTSRLDQIRPVSAAGLAFLVQPWGLLASGVAIVAGANLSNGASWVVLVLFLLLASSSVIGLELFATIKPDIAGAQLTRLRHWIDTHTDQMIIYSAIGVGLYLTGKAIYLLVTAS